MIEECCHVKAEATLDSHSAAEGDAHAKVFNQELYDHVSHAWNAAFSGATPPFAGNMEDPTYLKIV